MSFETWVCVVAILIAIALYLYESGIDALAILVGTLDWSLAFSVVILPFIYGYMTDQGLRADEVAAEKRAVEVVIRYFGALAILLVTVYFYDRLRKRLKQHINKKYDRVVIQ